MSSPLSDMSDPPPPRRRPAASDDDDDDDARSISPAPKAAEDDLGNMFDDDEDEPVPKSRSRRQASHKDSGDEEDLKDDASELDADLFGDGSDMDMDDTGPAKKGPTLDDSELDSGDDSGNESRRRRKDDHYENFMEEERDETSYEVDIGLHKLPQSTDDEVYLLKIPQFISLAPQVFKPETFQAPKLPPDAAITPYTFATTAIRWRHSPYDSSKLESNSRIIQWSDGTFSLQIGSSREGLYDLPTNPLIPPQDREYNPAHDSFTFLAEPLANSRLVRFFAHATQTMGVVSASNNLITDDIKQMVAARYQASQKRRTDDGMKQVELSYKIEDPEKARRDAEALEREVERNRKRIEARKIKEAEAGVGGPRKPRRGPGGLGMDDLEEEDDDGRSYQKKKSGGYSRRDKDDYYDDDDDGFIEQDPDTDEEEEVSESEEEEEYQSSRKKDKKKGKKKKKDKRRHREEEEDDEDEEPEAEFTDDEDEPQRAKSPKTKARPASEAGDDEDGDGELSRAPERKKRRIIMDDSDDDE
ncbi:hypothetical protein TWF730_002850 [Orbilia blumenaviensis]|uniref:RNA polymerase-associated protein LEO1 n=1 Tax=Orbilia blumenaviensis TaxID=1796055 RepID=A0AAV9U9Z0_9PEZI